MSNKTPCSYLTRRGRPCRNPAAPGSDPPACPRHRDRPAPQARQPALPLYAPAAPLPARPRATHFYLPAPAADALRALEADAPAGDLQSEIDLVRTVLRQLLAYLNESAGDMPPTNCGASRACSSPARAPSPCCWASAPPAPTTWPTGWSPPSKK